MLESPLSFSPLLRHFINHSENTYSPGGLTLAKHGCTLTHRHTHTRCAVIHHGAAHSYPIENALLTVELHTNTSHFCFGRPNTCPHFQPPPPPPLTLILYSEREKRGEVVATVLDSSYQPREDIYRLGAGGPRLNFVSHATDEAKTDIGGGSTQRRGSSSVSGREY